MTDDGANHEPDDIDDSSRYVATESARVDLGRRRRRGLPEAVFCAGKSPQQVREIFSAFAADDQIALGTRATEADFLAVSDVLPATAYDPGSGLLLWHPRLDAEAAGQLLVPGDSDRDPSPPSQPYVAVVSAGTADEKVLREAVGTLKVFGHPVRVVHDAGVAGLQRILDHVPLIRDAVVVIVVAGMDGALPSVVAGLVPTPVIAVPTSAGYGSHFGGLSALLAMINSCAGGISVVNIDNGFGAAYSASLIMRKVVQRGTSDHVIPEVDSEI